MTHKIIATALAACALISLGSVARGNTDQAALDVSAVTKIVIMGEASRLTLTTAVDQPYTAGLSSARKGWFARWQTSWFSNDCTPTGAMRIEDRTLVVDIPSSSMFDFSDCTVEVGANLPAGLGVSIDQAALQASLVGDFADVTVRGRAADVSLNGHAAKVDIAGEAIRTNFDFSGKGDALEQVRIDAKALDATLTFAEGAPVSYKIDATASFVDSKRTNTPGARSSVLIKGEFVRATIR